MSESGSGEPVDSSAANDKDSSVCPVCDESFQTPAGMKIHRGNVHGKLTKECERCSSEFEIEPNRKDTARFCSEECRDKTAAKEREKPRVDVVCEECGSEYKVISSKVSETRFCSQDCLHEHRRNRLEFECDYCGSKYETIPSFEDITSYCSDDCKHKAWAEKHAKEGPENHMWNGGKETLICNYCSGEYKRKSQIADRSKFCCRECKDNWASENKVGENSVNWKGGISDSRYYGQNWEKQRHRALERDGHTCQDCGKTSNLHVHHIQPIRKYDDPTKANRLKNLVTLCQTCHLSKWEGLPVGPDTR